MRKEESHVAQKTMYNRMAGGSEEERRSCGQTCVGEDMSGEGLDEDEETL